MEIQFPIFVRGDDGEVEKYSSIASMQGHLEKIDVENEEYEAWDSSGVPLSLSVQQPIWLRVEPQASAEPEALAAAITEFARRCAIPVNASRLSAGDFASALDELQLKLQERSRSGSWLHRLLRSK